MQASPIQMAPLTVLQPPPLRFQVTAQLCATLTQPEPPPAAPQRLLFFGLQPDSPAAKEHGCLWEHHMRDCNRRGMPQHGSMARCNHGRPVMLWLHDPPRPLAALRHQHTCKCRAAACRVPCKGTGGDRQGKTVSHMHGSAFKPRGNTSEQAGRQAGRHKREIFRMYVGLFGGKNEETRGKSKGRRGFPDSWRPQAGMGRGLGAWHGSGRNAKCLI